MGTKAEGAETARLCRIQAALSTNPDVRSCLLRMADIYQAEAETEPEGNDPSPVIAQIPPASEPGSA